MNFVILGLAIFVLALAVVYLAIVILLTDIWKGGEK